MTDTIAPPRPADGTPPPRGSLPEIPGPLDTALWLWRRLRRMSTALALLFAMAAAAIVATFIPQEPVIPPTVADWRAGVDAAGNAVGPGRTIARAFDALGFFDVFGSWWFATLVTLLFVSLTGCLLPRYRAFLKAAMRPPAAGRNLERLTARQTCSTSQSVEDALATAERVLRRRRFRRRRIEAADSPTGSPQLATERGHWREGGSLIFHTAFYLLLVGVVVGHTLGFTGQVNLVEGTGFTDTRLSYEAAAPGRFFGVGDHRGFRVTLEDFTVDYHENFTPADFVSRIVVEGADGASTEEVRVNHPVSVEGMKIYQARFGMAPRVVVRLASTGQVLHDGPVMLTEAGANQWSGVAKVPVGGGSAAAGGEESLPEMALDLALLPDAEIAETADGPVPVSASPRADNPVLFANVYVGELGLERAVPPSELRSEWTPEQVVGDVALGEGHEAEVAGGAFTIEFAELRMWSGFQVSRAPGRGILLAAAGLLLAGLLPSLYAYRRRIWVTARSTERGTEVVLAGAALQRTATFSEEFTAVGDALRRALGGQDEDRSTEVHRG